MAKRLQDRVAIVTGSDSGIGQATAEEFAKEGADVVVTYLEDQDGAGETRRRVETAGRRAVVAHLDVRDPTEVAHLFERTERELGTPYILVNNAGIDSTVKPVADMPLEDWDNEMQTYPYGPFYCCRHAIRARKAAGGGGEIINVTSVHQGQSGFALADHLGRLPQMRLPPPVADLPPSAEGPDRTEAAAHSRGGPGAWPARPDLQAVVGD